MTHLHRRLTLVELYESRHAAEPSQGYDAKATEWRAKLVEDQKQRGESEASNTNESE